MFEQATSATGGAECVADGVGERVRAHVPVSVAAVGRIVEEPRHPVRRGSDHEQRVAGRTSRDDRRARGVGARVARQDSRNRKYSNAANEQTHLTTSDQPLGRLGQLAGAGWSIRLVNPAGTRETTTVTRS